MALLLIEDEARIASFLARGLHASGYMVDVAPTGAHGLTLAASGDHELAILDLVLPDVDGIDVLRRLRERRPGMPVIVLSALSDLRHKVDCLELGADDYVTKPFAFPELLARVRARLRTAHQTENGRLVLGALALDVKNRCLELNGRTAELTAREFALAHYLFQHAGEAVTRAELLGAVWGYSFDPESNVVEVYVRHLRQKFADLGAAAEIQTLRGLGYRLAVR